MEFIFCKLPNDIKKYILLYDEHFIVRNGKIIFTLVDNIPSLFI